jgi:hypothetical protein
MHIFNELRRPTTLAQHREKRAQILITDEIPEDASVCKVRRFQVHFAQITFCTPTTWQMDLEPSDQIRLWICKNFTQATHCVQECVHFIGAELRGLQVGSHGIGVLT